MKFCTLTLGCKVNQYDTHSMEGILIQRGHTLSEAGNGCDACIINTCAVTAESARKSRQAVRRMKKLEPGALIAVCGCLSQLKPDETKSLGADLIGGSGDRQAFALELERLAQKAAPDCWTSDRKTRNNHTDFVGTTAPGRPKTSRLPPQRTTGGGRPYKDFANYNNAVDCRAASSDNRQISHTDSCADSAVPIEHLPPGGAGGRTRALLKIQDGCDNYCAYCVIPYARGRARSLPIPKAAEYAGSLASLGYREIVITGVEISSYGKDLPGKPSLIDVIRAVSASAPAARLRLGSLDPGFVTDSFIRELCEIAKLCPHFHLSLQSGCDETLRRMGRNYDTGKVMEAISGLRHSFPGCGVTADLITGFPGETEHEFGQTLKFIENAAFSGMHIFPYSPRPGTRAAAMPGQVKKAVRAERAKAASAIAANMALSFMQIQVGRTLEVLFERKCDGHWLGHSGNYLEVAVKTNGAKNEVLPVQITHVEDDTVYGVVDD